MWIKNVIIILIKAYFLKTMLKKILGYVLLATGLIMILLSLYFSFRIFTDKSSVPEIFKTQSQALNISGENAGNFDSNNIQDQMGKLINEKIKEILPFEFLLKFLNLLSWSLLAWILIYGGSIISGIGIKLLK